MLSHCALELGASMIIGIWFAGTVILGLFVLFTRPKA